MRELVSVDDKNRKKKEFSFEERAEGREQRSVHQKNREEEIEVSHPLFEEKKKVLISLVRKKLFIIFLSLFVSLVCESYWVYWAFGL